MIDQQDAKTSDSMMLMRRTNRDSLGILICLVLWFFVGPALAFAEKPVSNTYADAIEQAKLATVGILQSMANNTEELGAGAPKVRGSGVHMGAGVIVTARHAVEQSEGGKRVIPKDIRVLTDDLQELLATRQGANTYLDVAVYRLQGDKSRWPVSKVHFAERNATYGDDVFTVGYPMGRGPTLSFGKVGNPNTFLSTIQSRLVQIDLSACRGNSGGGLLNHSGELVGLIHAIIQTEMAQAARACSRFGFALPGTLVKRVVEAVLADKTPGFSVLGIQLKTLKTGGRWEIGVAKATGPSRHAGLKKGDILVAIDELKITSPAQLKNYLIEKTQPGQTVVLHVQRGKTQRTIPVKLGKS